MCLDSQFQQTLAFLISEPMVGFYIVVALGFAMLQYLEPQKVTRK
jgi:hypothetical protein